MAVLCAPIVFENKDFDPIAVLKEASSRPGLFSLLLNNAESPIATRLPALVFNFKASLPIAILLMPDMLDWTVRKPKNRFPVKGCNSPAGILFILKRNGLLSVVPRN